MSTSIPLPGLESVAPSDPPPRRGPRRYQPGTLLHWVSNHKNELRDPEDATKDARNNLEETYAAAYTTYQRRLREANALDFDDLIMFTVHLFQQFPEVRETYRRRFRHVLVD